MTAWACGVVDGLAAALVGLEDDVMMVDVADAGVLHELMRWVPGLGI